MDKSLIKQARQANLAEYLLSLEEPLTKEGNRYKHKEHDSLVFTDNAYYWNSTGEHGNAIDYLTRHMGMDFKKAVTALTNHTPADEQPPPMFNAFNFASLSISDDNSKVVKYLNETRCIGLRVINHLIENKLLYQEKQTNNAIFPMYDENNNVVGAELQGILPDKRFKGVKGGSKYGYGFNVRFSSDNTYDYSLFFESAVDLLSFIDYKRNHEEKNLDRCILISMAGLKINILRHTLKAFNGKLKVVLCVDNDEAGQKFKSEVEGKKIPFTSLTPSEEFKDWNEQTKALRESKPIKRLIERKKMF